MSFIMEVLIYYKLQAVTGIIHVELANSVQSSRFKILRKSVRSVEKRILINSG